jgi:hypothetical protein
MIDQQISAILMNTLAKGFLFHDGPPAAGLVVCPE